MFVFSCVKKREYTDSPSFPDNLSKDCRLLQSMFMSFCIFCESVKEWGLTLHPIQANSPMSDDSLCFVQIQLFRALDSASLRPANFFLRFTTSSSQKIVLFRNICTRGSECMFTCRCGVPACLRLHQTDDRIILQRDHLLAGSRKTK